MEKYIASVLAILIIGAFGLSQIFFIVDERKQAILLQFGEPVGAPRGPGLHTKIPLIQNVRYFDGRILSVDPAPEQVVISSDSQSADENAREEDEDSIDIVTGEPIIVDTFARYKITDPLRFLKTLRDIRGANNRLEGILKNATQSRAREKLA